MDHVLLVKMVNILVMGLAYNVITLYVVLVIQTKLLVFNNVIQTVLLVILKENVFLVKNMNS